ncbi:hypothetical protein AQUCO_02500222v1 [Aquilegia coerulea]|uniref:Uncharacterized protein n=1 Tax=Aquilegia coerulea TaxID=218851 RepID=A0A2G5DA55_AQUCA|nr:hypothetical protein AQUCO_02500222v1 [Aquilegia coerulea]
MEKSSPGFFNSVMANWQAQFSLKNFDYNLDIKGRYLCQMGMKLQIKILEIDEIVNLRTGSVIYQMCNMGLREAGLGDEESATI